MEMQKGENLHRRNHVVGALVLAAASFDRAVSATGTEEMGKQGGVLPIDNRRCSSVRVLGSRIWRIISKVAKWLSLVDITHHCR